MALNLQLRFVIKIVNLVRESLDIGPPQVCFFRPLLVTLQLLAFVLHRHACLQTAILELFRLW